MSSMPAVLRQGWGKGGPELWTCSDSFASSSIESLTLACALVFIVIVSPYTKSSKSAHVEVLNWNLLNEMDYERLLFATIPNDKVCDCGCHGRHTIDSMLGIFNWSMKVMLGGVHPLTRHDLQPLDAQRSLLAGRPLGFSGGLFPNQG